MDPHRAADTGVIRMVAIALLARREYSRHELLEHLGRRGYAPDACERVAAELAEERLLDDERYAQSFVRVHVQRGQGPRRIRQEMQSAGLAAALIQEALAQAGDWHALAREVRERRFGAVAPADWPERSRQARFLQYRGFSNDHIRSALGGSEADLPIDADS